MTIVQTLALSATTLLSFVPHLTYCIHLCYLLGSCRNKSLPQMVPKL